MLDCNIKSVSICVCLLQGRVEQADKLEQCVQKAKKNPLEINRLSELLGPDFSNELAASTSSNALTSSRLEVNNFFYFHSFI